MSKQLTIGLIGNPNCGKTTLFNGLTGAKQHIGNWPGVTAEKKEGVTTFPGGETVNVVDLPGVYSLTATSEDERATLEYVLSHEADLYVNVLDDPAHDGAAGADGRRRHDDGYCPTAQHRH